MFDYPLDDDLFLELVAPRHAEEMFAAIDANRGHLQQWHPWVEATRSPADSRRALDSMRRQFAENGHFHTAIRWRAMFVGMVGFNEIDWRNRYAALGYWLTEDAQGQGLMTRACRVYTAHAFDVLGLNRIEIRCAETNRRSRAVAERLGFELDGVLRDRERLYDRFVNHAIYGLHADAWQRQQGRLG